MHYFSGFSLKDESALFDFWLPKSSYSVVGFSYGAIKAVEYTLNSHKRVDNLVLLSPAFFNNKSDAFKKMQLLYYKKNPKLYIKNFIQNVIGDCTIDLSQYLDSKASLDDLKQLLYYKWENSKLEAIQNRGTNIEVILGENDKIIDTQEAKEFFQNFTTVYFIKNASHILRRKEK